ncbi:AAA family ATPase [Ningiella sp. W23]|uniref:AAA family ATPase n=1 Tax=Ningiella sp. W23 TaxID=3023715 RepID=UPI003756EF5C
MSNLGGQPDSPENEKTQNQSTQDISAPEAQSHSQISTGEIEKARHDIQALIDNIETSLIGQRDAIEQVLVAFIAGGHVLIEGVPGLGKTLLVKLLATSIKLDYKRVQFTPDLMPADVTGHSIVNMKSGEFMLKKGPAFTNLLLADEINRAPAKTQAALLEVMQERQITIDGKARMVGNPFMVLATQNPIDNEGTYPLPEAELDRFMMKVLIDYPSKEDELVLTKQITHSQSDKQSGGDASSAEASAVLDSEVLGGLTELAQNVIVDDKIMQYAVNIVRSTRAWQGIVHGAGVRASIALIQAAKVAALMQGQSYVTPDHVKRMVNCVLRHRVTLSAEREIAGVSVDEVLNDLCESVDVPRQ